MIMIDVIEKTFDVKGDHTDDDFSVASEVGPNKMECMDACVRSGRKSPATKLVRVEDRVMEDVKLDAMCNCLLQEFAEAF